MAPSSFRSDSREGFSDLQLAAAVCAIVGLWATLMGGAVLANALAGRRRPTWSLVHPFLALWPPTRLDDAWDQTMAPTWLYWTTTGAILAASICASTLIWRFAKRKGTDQKQFIGAASSADIRHSSGSRALKRRSGSLRPSLTKPSVNELGFRLGSSKGVACYCAVEDSVIVLGPPRSGKGLQVAIPMILDAPGAVLTTSTRPDSLAVTIKARQRLGPVAVFDPQGLAGGVTSVMRWSPVRGCADPHVAMVRAKALTTSSAEGTTDSTFWQASAEQAVRCLLHAAALGGCSTQDLYRWSLSALQAREAVRILGTHPAAAPAWHQALDGILAADPKQRDSVWAMVTIAFSALADPAVLDAVSPGPDEVFDPEDFLRRRGAVYVLGTSSGASATAGLVGAFVEDITEAARRLAARSPAARLDPPLTLVLDEAANYPLPSLPSLMSDGGGSGICTVAVLQSLAQARTVWGEHAAAAIWDAAIVKVILGGGSHARDLQDLSALIGDREEQTTSTTRGRDGHTTTSTATQRVPILPPARLRTLPCGTAVLLLRSAAPIALTLSPWTKRRDAAQLTRDRAAVETSLHGPTSGIPRMSELSDVLNADEVTHGPWSA